MRSKASRSVSKFELGRVDDKPYKKALAIAKVAARLFNEKGYIETSLDDIAAAARVSKGAIYHYFDSKDEMLFFILTNYMDVILQGLEDELQAIDEPTKKIRWIVSRHIRLYVDHVAPSKTLLHDLHCLPTRYFKIIAEKERTYYRIVSNALSTLFEGDISEGHLTVLTFSLFGMCNWIYSWYSPRGPVTVQELVDIICDTFLHGVIRDGHTTDPRVPEPGSETCE
jgi:TetR/AcrR family transcriptional regulator, cholesterol catabolism regulator